MILKTLRRYAEALGLPGDRLVLALVDLWPATGPPAPANSLGVPGAARTGVMAAASAGVADVGSGTETLVADPPETRYTDFDTAAVPRVYVENDPTASNPLGPPQIAGAYLDTGVHAAVGRGGGGPLRRPKKPARVLRWLVVLVGLAVLLGCVGLVIYAIKPSWFHKIGIGQSSPPTTATSVPATTAPRSTGHSPSTTTPHRPTGRSGGSGPSNSALSVNDSGSGTATATVRGANPTIRVSANGGPCWVMVTASGQTNPEFASDVNDGGQQDFPMGHSLSVQLGSGTGRITVLEGSKVVGTYTPEEAPITITFQPSA